jgi:TolB-like protein
VPRRNGAPADFGRRALVIAVTLIMAAVGIAYFVVSSDEGGAPVRIAVMPFEPPAGRADGWQPIAEWILEDLMVSAGASATIVGPASTAKYAGSDDRLRELAADYDLQYIVNGRFPAAPGGPRMLAELIRVSDGAQIWARGYDNLADGRVIGIEISRNVARELAIARP